MLSALKFHAPLKKCNPALITNVYLQGQRYQIKPSNFVRASRHTMSDSKARGGTELSPWQQGFYKYFLPIQTRVRDTDMFGHVNNSVYYSYFDTVINEYLYKYCEVRHPKKNPDEPNIVGFMVDTRCSYRQPLNFPEVILAGMAVTKLGNSSVTYTVGIFAEREASKEVTKALSIGGHLIENNDLASFDGFKEIAASVGQCVHVFVDLNGDQRPLRIPDESRIPLSNIMIPFEGQISKL
nr:uncharacterized protein LOC129272919 [Lytechinus pictus]